MVKPILSRMMVFKAVSAESGVGESADLRGELEARDGSQGVSEMSLATILLAAWIGLSPVDDPQGLVEQLGAARYADREVAAEALRNLGREALPALRAARDHQDPEVQSRASSLVEEIEINLMVQPTQVRLDFQDRPIAEVVRSLSEQSGLTLNLVPENNPTWNNRRISLIETEPVLFWQALDELCRVAQVQINPGVSMTAVAGQGQRQATLNLLPSATLPGPSDISGPFRVAVNKLDYQRTRVFNQSGASGMVGVAVPQGGNAPRPVAPRQVQPGTEAGPPVSGSSLESFQIELQVMAEPRMTIAQDGPPRINEAVDDKGHSMTASNPENDSSQRVAGYSGINPASGTNLSLSLPLEMPEQPGAIIKRLKGVVPIVVMARKDEPLVVPLTEKTKTFQNSQVAIQVHGVNKDQGQPFITIDLTVKLTEVNTERPFRQGFAEEMMVFRNHPGNPQNQVEVVDAQGRPFSQWFAFNAQPDNDGTRLTLRVMPTQADGMPAGEPAEIRFYEMARADAEIQFELTDIPMP